MGRPPEEGGEGPDDLTVEEIRAALRGAAQAYEPSRPAIERRIAAGRRPKAGYARRAFFTMRPVGAAVAVVVISALSMVAVRASDDDLTATVPAVLPSASAPVSPSRPSPFGSPSHRTSPPASASPSRPPVRTSTPAGPAPRTPGSPSAATSAGPSSTPAGFLTSTGAPDPSSNATFSQRNVTITTTRALSALRVTIKVPLTGAAGRPQDFTTAPNNDITRAVSTDATALTYTYVLNTGATLAPGKYVFAAQFHHLSGRDGAADSYTVDARAGGVQAVLDGGFS